MRFFRFNRRLRSRGQVPVRPRLESLESRTLLSVNVQLTAQGTSSRESSCGCYPPDPDIAAGPDYLVGTVNTAIAFYDKAGSRVFLQPLLTFFNPIHPGGFFSDPVVTYDEMSGRFFVGILDISSGQQRSFFDFAVSNTSNPLDGFSEMHKVETTETLADGQKVWSDYPKIGYNADAFVVTLNMDLFSDPIGTNPDHGQIIVFDKATLLDGDPDTVAMYHSDRPGPVYAPDPAPMHGSQHGDPLYFVQEVTRFGADRVDVVQMTNELTDNPTYTDTIIPVAPYARPGQAVNPNGRVDTFESFFLNADWRDNRLVATQDIGVDGVVRARWYEFSTAGAQPSLTQLGDINQGDGVYTYFSSVAVAPSGDLAMTFEESSATELVSMYVTGQAAGDALGTMQTPVATHPGAGAYRVNRAGDYSGVSVDPNSDNLFWAENLYKSSDTGTTWDTGIALFNVTPNVRGLRPKLRTPRGDHNPPLARALPHEQPVPPPTAFRPSDRATVAAVSASPWAGPWDLDGAAGLPPANRPAVPALLPRNRGHDPGLDPWEILIQ